MATSRKRYNKNYFGNKLREIVDERKKLERGFVSRMSRETGIGLTSFHQYFHGTEPGAANAILISEFLGIPPWDWIITSPLNKPIKEVVEVDEI